MSYDRRLNPSKEIKRMNTWETFSMSIRRCRTIALPVLVLCTAIAALLGASAQEVKRAGPPIRLAAGFQQNPPPAPSAPPLYGFADFHAHLMAHLAYD